MSLFRKTETRSVDPSAFVTDSGWSDNGGMTQDRLLSIAPAYSAIKLISETIATLPLHAYRKTADSRRQALPLPAWLADPIDGSTTVDFIQRGVVSALTHGNAWGLKSGFGTAGEPTGVQWLNPARVIVDESGVMPRFYVSGREVDHSRLVHIPAVVVPGSLVGISPIRAFAVTLGSAETAQLASRDWARNRQVPGLEIEYKGGKLTDEQADAVSARARSKIRNGEPFVHGSDWGLNVMTIPAGDAAFLESMKGNATTVASIFNIPPEMVGGTTGASLTYNTVEGQTDWLLMFTLRSWVSKFEAAFFRLMPQPQYVKFNVDAFKRVDTRTRYSVYQTARQIGMRSINELRALEDLEPIADGDDFAPLSAAASPSPAPEEVTP